jgi:uncharacterized protein
MSEAKPTFVAPGPVRPNQRIDALDVLRGLALLGVLLINLVTEFRVSIFEQFLPNPADQGRLDRSIEAILSFLFSLKALALFSLLFGVGLAIQYERLGQNPQRLRLLLRRLAILLAFGLIHLVFIWNGDILTHYAVAGFLILPFLFGPRWLLLTASVAFFGVYLAIPLLPFSGPLPDTSWMIQHVREARTTYSSGGFAQVLAFRIRELPEILSLHLDILPRTVALFLLGATAWRAHVLRDLQSNKYLPFRIGLVALGAGAFVMAATVELASIKRWYFLLDRSAPSLMAIGYAAILLGIMTTDARRTLAWAAPVGRMAFTNYLLQSIILGWVFYGYGLGLFGRVGVAAALAMGIALYILQVLFSIWWLRRYAFGPIEWLWRTLMYGVAQPMRLRKTALS